jgi:hypothetical protein
VSIALAARATRQAPDQERPGADLPGSRPKGALKLAAQVIVALMAAVFAIAAIVRAAVAAPVRHWLAYPFIGIPARPGVAAGVFLHNALVLAGIVSLVVVGQARYHTTGPPIPWRFQLAARWVADCLLGSAVAVNVVSVGASLGAYGSRMVRAALPHGPVEISAFALALALYVQGRDRPLSARHVATVLALALTGLAIAAMLETYVTV